MEPRETPIHTSGYSCSGATTISNSLTGLGRGKSKCCNREGGKGKCQDPRFILEALSAYLLCLRKKEDRKHKCLWQLCDVTGGHKWVYKLIKKPSGFSLRFVFFYYYETRNLLLPGGFDLLGTYLNKHELVHWLVPLQQHHAGLQTATQKHAASLQVFSCGRRDGVKEHADIVLWL